MLESPRRIGLVGDVHGSIDVASRAIGTLARENIDTIHFLGDFGFLWDGAESEEWMLEFMSHKLAEHGARALVTGGNHEGYDEWAKIPADECGQRWVRKNIGLLPRGWRAVSPAGRTIASFGGANSVDMPSRVRAKSGYWEAEQITESDLATLGTDKVDVLLGHDAPMATALLARLAGNRSLWEPEGLAYAERGHAMYHRAVRQVSPALTVSGHYHLHLDVTESFTATDGTPFDTHVVLLNADGHPPTIAVLDTDALDIDYPAF